MFNDAPDDVVDAGDHSVVGSEVGGVFFRGVPSPEKSNAIHRFFHEVRVAFKNLRVGKAWLLDRDVFIKTVYRLGPGEMADAGALITVLGVGCVKTN